MSDDPTRNALLPLLQLFLDARLRSPDAPGGDAAPPAATPFDAPDTPPISPRAYLARLLAYLDASPAVFLLAFHSLFPPDRPQPLRLTETNIHRALLAAVALACKFAEDYHDAERHLASVGGVSARELKTLQLHMLATGAFHPCLDERDYARFVAALVREVAQTGDHGARIARHAADMLAFEWAAADDDDATTNEWWVDVANEAQKARQLEVGSPIDVD